MVAGNSPDVLRRIIAARIRHPSATGSVLQTWHPSQKKHEYYNHISLITPTLALIAANREPSRKAHFSRR